MYLKTVKRQIFYKNVKVDATIPENKDFFAYYINPIRWYIFGLVVSFIKVLRRWMWRFYVVT